MTTSSPIRVCAFTSTSRAGAQAPVWQWAGVPIMYPTGLPEASAWVSVTAWSGHGDGVSVQYGSTPRWLSTVGVSNGGRVEPTYGTVTAFGSLTANAAPNPSSPS